MKGRKPLPLELRLLTGNAGKRRIRTAPQPAPGIPACPTYLDPEARAEWGRATSDLAAMGSLFRCDHATLEAYCVAYAEGIALSRLIKQYGRVYTSRTREGNRTIKKNPAVAMLRNAHAAMVRFAQELGLSAPARTRLNILPPATPDDLDEFLASRPKDRNGDDEFFNDEKKKAQ